MLNIETKRLRIRRFKEDDWKDLYEYLSDEEVVYYEPYTVFNEEQCKKEAVNRSTNEEFFAVCLKDSEKLIGNIYLGRRDFNCYEIGYVFNRNYQKQGYATEASKAVLDYAFDELHARRIIGKCNPKNKASYQLMERIGMRREGHLLQSVYFKVDENQNPIWSDTYEYALLKSER